MSRDDLDAQAMQILRDNDRGGYTVPTSGLYPFQWNWDSCFVALGWQRFDEARAFEEIEMLLTGQWDDGMVPHIVFHRPDPGYFPGPDRWGTRHTPMTSGITQPPVAASCLRRLVEHARDPDAAAGRARPLIGRLLAWHRWFHTVRDPEATGLVSTLHPWETGMDNSIGWDAPLAAVEIAPDLEPYVRKDITHVDPAMRPTQADYDRFMTLVHIFRSHEWRHEITRLSPFRVADVGTNCILHRADRDLLHLAERFGEDAASAELRVWIACAEASFPQFADPATGMWHSIDLRTGERIPARTHAGFLAFWAGQGTAALADVLKSWSGGTRYGLASVSPTDAQFDGKRYWRGPIWAVVNFMVGTGLEEAGYGVLASRLRADTRDLVQSAGFYEYFDPRDGAGLGGAHFTWTAAMWLAWAGVEP